MEVKLENLIEKIKQDGVANAQQQAQELLKQAQEKAKSIIELAQNQASQITQDAQAAAKQRQAMTEAALAQAARDVLLKTKDKIKELFVAINRRKISQALDKDIIKQMLLSLIKQWDPQATAQFEVVVNEKDRAAFFDQILGEVKQQIKQNIELKVSADLDNGFLLGLKDNDIYCEVSEQSISEAVKSMLNSELAQLLDQK